MDGLTGTAPPNPELLGGDLDQEGANEEEGNAWQFQPSYPRQKAMTAFCNAKTLG
jgi:hypothetical protein